MPTEPFWKWCPVPGMAKTSKMTVDTNMYGDGYAHRATRGINPVRPSWTLTFPFVGADELGVYDDFLKLHATRGFWILPPGERTEIFVVCDEWSATFADKNNSAGLVGTLAATFMRVFNPQPVNLTP